MDHIRRSERVRPRAAFTIGALVCVLVGTTAGGATAACGDGVVQPSEACDHGTSNGSDGCCTAGCQLVDADGDGVCDPLDPCAGSDFFSIREPSLTLTRLQTPPGDDTLRFSGYFKIPTTPPVDPATDGIQFGLHRFFGGPMMMTSIPGGTGWTSKASGTAWLYRDRSGSTGGITHVSVKQIEPPVPVQSFTPMATFAFQVKAIGASLVLPTDDALYVTFAVGIPTALRQCGDTTFVPGMQRTCTRSPSGRRLDCSSGPRVGPCHVSDPHDLILCDINGAVRAQQTYFNRHQTYFSGSCRDLPGFVPSPDVTCVTVGLFASFQVFASHPSMRFPGGCTWVSDVPPTQSNLTCG